MKKFFDKYVFSRFGTQLFASVCILLLFALLAPSCRRMAVGPGGAAGFFASLGWGLKQVATPAGAVGTIETLDGVPGAVPAAAMFLMSLLCWLVCICVLSFVTGAIVNAFRNRKQLIDAGKVFYPFRDHGLVIGWDFQGPACVERLLSDGGCGEVLVVSAADAAEVRRDLRSRLGGGDLARVYVYNGSVTTSPGLLARSYPELARTIVVLGERGGADNDGANLHVGRLVHDRVAAARSAREGRPPVKVFLHIANPVLHAQALSVPKGGLPENDDSVDLAVVCYAESWAWKCWSKPGSDDGVRGRPGEPYLPLRHRPGARRVELFVVGDEPAGRTLARYALPLLNYGEDGRRCRVTVFGRPTSVFPEQRALDAMPECEVVFRDVDGGSREANEAMIAAASDPDASVTIVLAASGADATAAAYAGLANTLRRMDVSVLAWMPTESRRCPAKAFVRTCGDRAELRYFGMTDDLPWMDPERQEAGAAVNFFYDVAFGGFDGCALPPSDDPGFADAARTVWEKRRDSAREGWRKVPRWARWSSVNAGDAFKERAAAFPDFAADAAVRARLLRAEHDRWWTERLLAGWKPCEKPVDKADKTAKKDAFLHWDLVPFDELDEGTKALDRVPIAAMVALGFGAKD